MYLMYHGSSYDFDYFDESKIRAAETDAPYNGFWFSSDKNTLPAWTRLNYLYEVNIILNNPAPHCVIKDVVNQIKNDQIYREDSRSLADETRYRLIELGYDGVIHDDIPEIDVCEYEQGKDIYFSSPRGAKYLIKKDNEGYCEFCYEDGEFITNYYDLEDFLSQQEKTYVVFNSSQIEIINKIRIT